MVDVVPGSGIEIIDAQHFVAAIEQPRAQMRADESSSAGNKDAPFAQHDLPPWHRRQRKKALSICQPPIIVRAPRWSGSRHRPCQALPAEKSWLSSRGLK